LACKLAEEMAGCCEALRAHFSALMSIPNNQLFDRHIKTRLLDLLGLLLCCGLASKDLKDFRMIAFALAFVFLLGFPSTVHAQSGSDFSNNLFSDLG
jgi:hypothetical protein